MFNELDIRNRVVSLYEEREKQRKKRQAKLKPHIIFEGYKKVEKKKKRKNTKK